MIKLLVKFVDYLVKVELALAAVMTFVMGTLVFVSAMFRYVGDSPLSFSDELVALLFVLSAFFTAPYAARIGMSIHLDIGTKRLSEPRRKALARVTTLVGLCVIVLFAWHSIEEVQYSLEFSEVSEVSDIPVSPIKALAVFALVSMALALLTNFLDGEKTGEMKLGDAPNPGTPDQTK